MHTNQATTTAHPLNLRQVLRPGRSIHALDLENLAGGPTADYRSVASTYVAWVAPNPGDLVTVGVDASGAFAALNAFPSAGLTVGRGPDGADRALIRRIQDHLSTGRFDSLIVGSGDHAFVGVIEAARRQGLHTIVVAARGTLSRRLEAAAHRAIALPDSSTRSVHRDAGEISSARTRPCVHVRQPAARAARRLPVGARR